MDNNNMYYLYHIPGKKIGVTTDLYDRVECQQGYGPEEYDVIMSTEDINLVSKKEIELQKALGYRVDMKLYKDLYKPINNNNNNMRINVTEQTTTFPCPVNKLKGNLMDNIGMEWNTEHGNCIITNLSIEWIMEHVKTSQFTNDRCYVYNKALTRWFENNNPYADRNLDNAKQNNDQYNGKTRTGALSPAGICEHKSYQECDCGKQTHFDLIREWASERGLYDEGDPRTQALKLVEEVGETCKAILNNDHGEIVDGIGDCVVVLTNLAELIDTPIEECIEAAYDEIKERSGKMVNGTFKKD